MDYVEHDQGVTIGKGITQHKPVKWLRSVSVQCVCISMHYKRHCVTLAIHDQRMHKAYDNNTQFITQSAHDCIYIVFISAHSLRVGDYGQDVDNKSHI